jgi:hypothetical protein
MVANSAPVSRGPLFPLATIFLVRPVVIERNVPMPQTQDKYPITIVSAVMRSDGFADFAINEVEVTQDEYENGIHLYIVEAELIKAGYDEPFVHYPEGESPPFLLPAVKDYLGAGAHDTVLQATH